MPKRSFLGYFAALLALALLALPDMALAATSFFSPVPEDQSLKSFLRPMFGSLFDGPAGGAFEMTMGILNGAALILGGVLAAYTLIIGTMQTAHDGEMLGKKWSSLWVPIRTVLGIGLVVPIGGGYCVAQMLLAWLTTQGIGLADASWEKFVGAYADPAKMAPTSMMPRVEKLAISMLDSNLCLAAYNDIRSRDSNSNIMASPMKAFPSDEGISYGKTALGAECGKVEYGLKSRYLAARSTGSGASGMVTSGIEAVFAPAFPSSTIETIQKAQIDALHAMDDPLSQLASDLVTHARNNTVGATPPSMAPLQTAVEKYQAAVASSAASAFPGADQVAEMKAAASKDGWMMAGAWFMKIAQMQDVVNKIVSAVPSSTAPSPTGPLNSFGDFDHIYGSAKSVLQSSTDLGVNMKSVAQVADTNDPFQSGVNAIVRAILPDGSLVALTKVNEDRHPLMSLKDFGDYLMTGSEAGIIASVIAIAAADGSDKAADAGLINKIPVVGNLVSGGIGFVASMGRTTGYILMALSLALLGFGVAIAIYLPMAPFLLFFGAFLGWLLLVAEAIVAAPLWAVMHLQPDGDGFMGGARPGYMLILGLLLRPVLIIFGFIVSLLALSPVVGFFNKVFFQIFENSMAGSMMGLVTMIAMVAIYFGTMLFLFHSIFGFIHKIPDKILRWIGGGGEQLGEHAEKMGGEGKAFAAGVVGGTLASGVERTASGLQQARAADETRKSRKQDRLATGDQMAMKTTETGTAAAKSLTAARSTGATPKDQLAAVGDLIEDSKQHDAAADQKESTLKEFGSSMTGEQRAEMEKAISGHKKAASVSRGQASDLIQDMTSSAKASASAGAPASDTANLYRHARDAQNLLDSSSSGHTPGAYSQQASALHEQVKKHSAKPAGGDDASTQTGGTDLGNRSA